MKRLISLIFLIASMLSPLAGQAETLSPFAPSLAPMLKNTMPAIVNVAVQGYLHSAPDAAKDEDQEEPPVKRRRPQKPKTFQSMGSGVVVDPTNGFIVTNDHVIRNASTITITLHDGRRLKAKLIGTDPASDIAVLQVKANKLESVKLGNSDKASVGDFVVAIGNPFGLNNYGNNQSATFGIISAMKRSDLNIEGVENFIQTDAAINPGNSGGALVNTKGELIGINTAIISPYGGSVGIGFAIPINLAKDVMKQLIQYGSVHRGLMGIFVQHLTPELAQAFGYDDSLKGALVSQVNEGSPAELAGLKSGDIITQINDTPITQASQVKTTISLLRVGTQAKITVIRKKKKVILDATVTDVKKHEQKLQKANPFLYGLALKNFEQDSPLHGNVVGVEISGASPMSAGWRSGLRPGDVIVAANQQRTPDVKSLHQVAAQSKNQVLIQVLRGPGSMFILVK